MITKEVRAEARERSNRASLNSLMRTLGDVEIEIMLYIGRRLKTGQKEYGKFDLKDNRDMVKEALEEVADASIYSAFELLRLDKFDVDIKFK